MSARLAIVRDLIRALKAADQDRLRELAQHLSDDVEMVSPMGSFGGKGRIIERLSRPPGEKATKAAGMMGDVDWGEPREARGVVKVGASLPGGLPIPLPIRGVSLVFSFDQHGRVRRIEARPSFSLLPRPFK